MRVLLLGDGCRLGAQVMWLENGVPIGTDFGRSTSDTCTGSFMELLE